jgi:hypothetical protein
LNPGRRGGKPATNRLSYGAAIYVCLYPFNYLSVWLPTCLSAYLSVSVSLSVILYSTLLPSVYLPSIYPSTIFRSLFSLAVPPPFLISFLPTVYVSVRAANCVWTKMRVRVRLTCTSTVRVYNITRVAGVPQRNITVGNESFNECKTVCQFRDDERGLSFLLCRRPL